MACGTKLDHRYLEYCETDVQRENIEAVIEHGSSRAAAKVLSKSKTSVQISVNTVMGRAAKAGLTDVIDNSQFVGRGYQVKGVSGS